MITIKEGSLFDAPCGLICHQVNCKGVMGAGVAKEFKERFPQTFLDYQYHCNIQGNKLLGQVLFSREGDYKYTTCCMAAQYGYGRDKNFVYTDYDAFKKCCESIASFVKDSYYNYTNVPINMPYKIGCGLANGDWSIIYKIIEEVFKDYNVILWRLNK